MLEDVERSFAKTCLDNGISKLDSSAHKEKCKLIAKQKNLENFEDIQELQRIINDYIAEENEKENAEIRKRINVKKKEEQKRKKELEKGSDAFGRDKIIQYYDNLIAEVQFTINNRDDAVKAADDIRKIYFAASNAVEPIKSPPERDWALAGGFASGLAGPAAGLAVASDIQRKNAESRIDPEEAAKAVEIQKKNFKTTGDSLAQKIISDSGISLEEYRNAKNQRNKLVKIKEKCEVLLVDDTNDKYQLLEMLSPSIESIDISESGSVQIKVNITGNIFNIYDDVPAVIDGSIKALLWNEEGQCCGIASLVLPVDGANDNKILEAWFTEPQSPDNKDIAYSVEFTKPNLWLIETLTEPESEQRSEIVPTENKYTINAESYYDAYKMMDSSDISIIRKASSLFESLGTWKDAETQKSRCDEKIKLIEEKQKREAQEREKRNRYEKQKQEAIRAEKVKKKIIIGIGCALVVVLVLSLIGIVKHSKTKK